MRSQLPEADFIRLFEEKGPSEIARLLDIGIRSVFERRQNIEKRIGRQLVPPNKSGAAPHRAPALYAGRLDLEIKNGVVLVGSDAHYWPGIVSTAHKAFVKFAKEMQPKAIIKNGDALDGASISRHPPINWEEQPTLIEEIETVQERLDDLELAAPKAKRFWSLGNHDGRFESRIATVAPQFAQVKGVHLKDHFPNWSPCWGVWINDNVVVKHRFKGGIHATHNNTLASGKTMVTGHLHSLKVTPYSDYNGTRWGVDCGTLADPYGPQFAYTELNPVNWRSGFAVLTFDGGRLLQPETCLVTEPGRVDFRGRILRV